MPKKTTVPRFSCDNLVAFIGKVPGNWTKVKKTLDHIDDNICKGGKIVSRKKVLLDDRECKNTMPVLNNWWNGYGLDRGKIPDNFVESIQKKTTCEV